MLKLLTALLMTTPCLAEEFDINAVNSAVQESLPEGLQDMNGFVQSLSQPFRLYHDLKLDGYLTRRTYNNQTISFYDDQKPGEAAITFHIASNPFRGLTVSTPGGEKLSWTMKLGAPLLKTSSNHDWTPERLFHFEMPNLNDYQEFLWKLEPGYLNLYSVVDGKCRRSDLNLVSQSQTIQINILVSHCLYKVGNSKRVEHRWELAFEGDGGSETGAQLVQRVVSEETPQGWQHSYYFEGTQISRSTFLGNFSMFNSNINGLSQFYIMNASGRGQWPQGK